MASGTYKTLEVTIMSIVKSSLNSLISKLVTRNRVIKATGCSEKIFNDMLQGYYSTKQHSPDEGFKDGVDCFISDFRKEGWCKTELRDILDTLFHLGREINEYGYYWF